MVDEVKNLFLAASLLAIGVTVAEDTSLLDASRVKVRVTPEVRTTYLSLGKIVEDRPMQLTNVRLGYDLDQFGRIGVRNWDVSSLSLRRADVHRRAFYHTEFGPTWEYDLELAEDWKLRNDATTSWTLYRGFENSKSNASYWWWQIDQSLDNPYLVPFWRIRRCVKGNDYLYSRIGVRRRFPVWEGLYLTPEVAVDGGSSRNQNRVFGLMDDGDSIGSGFYSVSPRFEVGWRFNENFTVYGWIEEYSVMGHDAREVNRRSSYLCAHNDWVHGGVGVRLSF